MHHDPDDYRGPLIRRLRERRADHQRHLVRAGVAAAALAAGLAAALVVHGSGEGIGGRLAGETTDRWDADELRRGLEDHPWWSKEVRPGAVDAFLEAATWGDGGDYFFDQSGEYVAGLKGVVVLPERTLGENIRLGRLPPAAGRLRGEIKRVTFRPREPGGRIGRAMAADALERALSADEATLPFGASPRPIDRRNADPLG